MLAKLRFSSVILASLCITVAPMTNAFAVTAEVARKCGALTDKAYAPLVPGNPAAGRANGDSHSIHKYFNRCVANGGQMHNNSGNVGK